MQWRSPRRQLVIPFPEIEPASSPPAATRGRPSDRARLCATHPELLAGSDNPTLELLGVVVMLGAFLAVAVLA